MTPLSSIKPVVRESLVRDAGRNVVVIIGPGNLVGFRLKGTRHIYSIPLLAVYAMAVKAEVAAKKTAKGKAKK